MTANARTSDSSHARPGWLPWWIQFSEARKRAATRQNARRVVGRLCSTERIAYKRRMQAMLSMIP